jgi:hypothetical protein
VHLLLEEIEKVEDHVESVDVVLVIAALDEEHAAVRGRVTQIHDEPVFLGVRERDDRRLDGAVGAGQEAQQATGPRAAGPREAAGPRLTLGVRL